MAAENLLIFKERNSTSYDIFWPLNPCACLSLPSHPSLRSFGSLIVVPLSLSNRTDISGSIQSSSSTLR